MHELDRVLIVDDDADVRDLLMDQIFNPTRFRVFEARDGVEGLAIAAKEKLDLIYIDLIMPSLTGKDMLVGLKSRNYSGPIIVGVKRGQETSAIEAFRFGATDYISKPIREAEMQSVVNRAMGDIRLRKERDQLFGKLEASNKQLEDRLNQLTTLQELGQTLTAMHSLDGMFDAVLQGAISVTGADHATLILLDDNDQLILRAGKNMTLVMQEKLGEVIKDDLARLVMMSQEPMVTNGAGLQRFKLSRDLLGVIYAPMTANGKAIGVLTAGNHKKRRAFDDNLADVMNALADYAAIAIVNARLFAALDQRAKVAQHQLKQRDAEIAQNIINPMSQIQHQLHQLLSVSGMPDAIRQQLQRIGQQTTDMQRFLQQSVSGKSS